MNALPDFIPNCVPNVGEAEANAARQAVAEGWLAVGPEISALEREVCVFTGAQYAVAVNTGTAALHLALLAGGVKAGDIVIVPSLTFAATAAALVYCGAEPMFFDSDPVSWGLSLPQVREYLSESCFEKDGERFDKVSGKRVGAIVPVHLYGHPLYLPDLAQLESDYSVAVIEDAAEALGASCGGVPVGRDSRLCVLSFNGNKVITGGNGGMVLTNSEALAERVRFLAAQAKADPVEFIHSEVGFNYRMTNVTAAILNVQMQRLPAFLARKREIFESYRSGFEALGCVLMWQEAGWARSSYWMPMLQTTGLEEDSCISNLRQWLRERRIEARPAWFPLHRQRAFNGSRHAPIFAAEKLSANSLCLPCSTGLSNDEQAYVVNAVQEFFGHPK
jgi:perosamine synthetase